MTTKPNPFIGTTIEIKWGTSRGRETYGYTTCNLYHHGRRITGCNGGGYDMRGTVLGNFITWAFADQLRKLTAEEMPRNDEYNHQTKQREDRGRYFYGLTFHDPNYDPSKAVIGKDCSDRTLSKQDETGTTVGEAEAKGVSFGLERIQAIYSASSKTPTMRHTQPDIDGACGVSCVLDILRALGMSLRHIVSKSKLDIYEIVELTAEEKEYHAKRIAA